MEETLHAQYFLDALNDVLASDQPDIDKLAWAFGRVTEDIVAYARQEIEVATALHDREAKIKVQIKMETIKHARQIFAMAYQQITGRSVWHE